MPSPQVRRRLPAFGLELVAAQKSGRNVPWLLIALDWTIGRAMPRVVVPKEIPAHAFDLRLARGLDCWVAHRDQPERALEVAHLALLAGARRCGVLDVGRVAFMTTADVLAARAMVCAA